MSSQLNSWWICLRENPRAGVRLFCFPYAGGAAPVFRTWPDGLPARFEVWAAQLPGRGSRLREPAPASLERLVESLGHTILPCLDRPFAFFGHSMGALACFELARQLRRQQGPVPRRLFISACSAPQLEKDEAPMAHLPEGEFLERLRQLNGTPRQVLENEELLQLLLPTLRADFAAFESYEYKDEPPLTCPITVLGGTQDRRIGPDRLEAWRVHTSASFEVHQFPGDHFFLHTAQALVFKTIAHSFNLR
jgi:medium-chain acyl-[acyl-carrier-protein] hydrolase